MKNLIDLNNQIISNTIKYSSEFTELMGENYGSDCFASIHNHLVLSLEMLSFYNNIWSNQPDDHKYDQEKVERCVEVTKNLFISTVSLIEFNIRNIIDSTQNHILSDYINRSRRAFDEFDDIYKIMGKETQKQLSKVRKKLKDLPPCDSISKILQKSKSVGLITEKELEEWNFIVTVRNITVHNNCIGSKDLNAEINNRKFHIKENDMMHDNLDCYLYLTNHIINLFYNWAKNNYKKINV